MSARPRGGGEDDGRRLGLVIATVGLAIIFGVAGAGAGFYVYMRVLSRVDTVEWMDNMSLLIAFVATGALVGVGAALYTVWKHFH